MSANHDVPAHVQQVTNHYAVAYPEHGPREADPHYKDFHAWKAKQKADGKWRCAWAVLVDDDSDCDLTHPLEAHHGHIEFAMLNGIDFARLEQVYPGISDPDKAGAWIESDANLMLLCVRHHRGTGTGVHHLSAADYEASHYVKGVFG